MIHARALDLIEGRLGVVETSRALSKLAYWTGTRDDPDLLTFIAIDSETDSFPIGDVRKLWADHALALQDVEIAKAESFYRPSALEAASHLAERFEWTLEARNARRNAGHAV
jgi:hypothetical protein